MSASGDGPERLAEILREIIGLTKTARTNVPNIESREVVESAIESPGSLPAQGINRIDQACDPSGKQADEERGEFD